MLEWRRDWEVKVLSSSLLVVLVKAVEEAEGLPEVVVATTVPAGTTQTQTLRPVHQGPGVMLPVEVAEVDSEVVVVVAMEAVVVVDGSMSDMMPAAEGESFDGLDYCGARADITFVCTYVMMSLNYRYETEKRHGAGRGNWGTEEDAVKE